MANDPSRPSLGRLLVERGVITDEQLEMALTVQRTQGGLLGDVLTARGWVTPLSIAAALAKQRSVQELKEPAAPASPALSAQRGASWKPLGTLLVEKGCISDVQLKQALSDQRERGGFLGEILIERGWIAASDLVLALAAQLGLDFDVKRAAESSQEAAIVPTERPPAHFEVIEGPEGRQELLKTVETFLEATDFVFDEILWKREAEELQIIRVDAGRREIAWSYRRSDTPSSPKSDDLRSIFGYPVTSWQGEQFLHKPSDGPADAATLAAAG